MPEIDLSADSRIRQLLAMCRALSTATTPLEALGAFARWYWPLRPIDHTLSLSTRDLPEGQYRITRDIRVSEILAGRQELAPMEPWRHREAIPVSSGGILGRWIAGRGPVYVPDLSVPEDPVVGGLLRDMRSALVIPLYHAGEPIYWNIQFRRGADAFTPADIEQALLVGNLVAGNNTRLLLAQEITSLNARLTEQLAEVARVQASLLPQGKPEIPGLEIATSYLPSAQAGGDYFDFLPFDDGTWGLMIADVSGHGPGAATVMAMLHAILHAYTGPDRSPGAVLRWANGRLLAAGLEGSFVTAFFAVYDPRTARLTYARAGHNPPLLKRGPEGEVRFLMGAGALPLGLVDPIEIASCELTLRPADTVILYTDGVTEAMSAAREMFGPDRLHAALVRCTGQPDCVIDSVHTALYEHTRTRAIADDQTLVALRYTGAPRP